MIFDTHLHLIDRSRLSYPWLANLPPLDRDWDFDSYLATAARVGITDVLHMEVDVAEADIDRETAWVAELMARPGSPLRGAISAARPESDGFEAWLDRVDRRVVRGVRRVLHVVPDAVSQDARFRANVRKLGQAGLPFDICVLQRQLPLALQLVDVCPDTSFILDHCGVPAIAAGGFEDWAASITRLAKRPNVNVKLSGISAYGPADWSLQTLRPYVTHLIERFGPGRIVWGSDSPVCTLQSTLAEWVATTNALLQDLSSEDRALILSENARRTW
ncbi:amidohydrolase family protein [Stagnihabitans tardus]|uniref:Amidohydrolase family protein n=1 Tax=Stagnihabitans tardus TaxID=2699202 RepID=A0AAE5BXB4_9RHOB|nr:amidohydrolase [Stagnihabitans tardus]NBZ89809.1 amidohydrolase family protein [Stagnihabitans tardus]